MGLLSQHCGLWKQARGWGVACLGWGALGVGYQWGSGQAWVHQAGLHLMVKSLLCQQSCAIVLEPHSMLCLDVHVHLGQHAV